MDTQLYKVHNGIRNLQIARIINHKIVLRQEMFNYHSAE